MMKIPEVPSAMPSSQQLNLLFESNRLTGFNLLDRSKARILPAQILMQAAGLSVEELDDDKH